MLKLVKFSLMIQAFLHHPKSAITWKKLFYLSSPQQHNTSIVGKVGYPRVIRLFLLAVLLDTIYEKQPVYLGDLLS